MKKIIILFITLQLIISCNSDNNENNSLILGKWQLTDVWYGMPVEDPEGENNPTWHPVNNGYSYTFHPNGNFVRSGDSSNSCSGNYNNNLQQTELTIHCDTSDFIEIYQIEWENGNLILNFTNGNCIEGCKFKYKKIE